MNHIDWEKKENSQEIRRWFEFRLEESLAREFIQIVQNKNLYVRDTLVKLIREFILTYGNENESDTKIERKEVK